MATSVNWATRVVDLAIRPASRAPMQCVAASDASVGGSLAGDHGSNRHRGITLLASGAWQDACDDLGAELPWHARRANVLLEIDSLSALIGRRLRLGELLLHIHRETTPCGRMDEVLPGLCRALCDDCRGGVCGEILRGGTLRVGDIVTLEARS